MSRKIRIDYLYENSDPLLTYLQQIFTIATEIETDKYLFSDIYLPVRMFDENTQKLDDDYTYIHCGMSINELSDLYWTEYSGLSLIGAGCGKSVTDDVNKIATKCRSIFNKNKGKYLKLIEQYGLEWNPLWNVDGTEIRQTLENQGVNDVVNGPQDSTNGVTMEHQVSAYDSGLKSEWKDIQKGKVETTYTHNNAKNIVNGADADYEVSASDTAFGYALKGGDKMHIEKYLRQGNIGVTKTTELLEDARKYLRFSLVQEFFDDINKVILIGTYDN